MPQQQQQKEGSRGGIDLSSGSKSARSGRSRAPEHQLGADLRALQELPNTSSGAGIPSGELPSRELPSGVLPFRELPSKERSALYTADRLQRHRDDEGGSLGSQQRQSSKFGTTHITQADKQRSEDDEGAAEGRNPSKPGTTTHQEWSPGGHMSRGSDAGGDVMHGMGECQGGGSEAVGAIYAADMQGLRMLLATTEQDLASAQQDLASTQQDLATVQTELSTAHAELRNSQRTVIVLREELDASKA